MNFDVSLLDLLTLLVNVVLPLLVGLVTTRVTNASAQAILLAVLTAITGFVSEWIEKGEAFDIKSALYTWLTGLAVAIAVHYGIWRPVGAKDFVLDHGVTSRAA